MNEDFKEEDFGNFVRDIDDQLLEAAHILFKSLRQKIEDVNTPHGIYAQNSFNFRLIEYGRNRVVQLSKLGFLASILTPDEPKTPVETAIRLAFELGSAAAEQRVIDMYEDYIHDGIGLSEWRQEGLPKARAERLRQGRRTRNAIAKAAQDIYTRHPDLVRNDSEIARRVLKMRIPDLQKGNGMQIGFDAVIKHLRALRSEKLKTLTAS